jgi:hypothetical protein
MKFKYLMIAFIAIIAIVILITALLPLILTGPEFTANFQYVTLPLMIFMGFILVGMTLFFLLNYRLLSLLEREDWPALSYYLEQIVFVKGRYSARRIKILASSYLVITDYASVLKLESKAMLAKPSVVEKNALIFGAARVLSGDCKAAAAFFHTYMKKGNKYERQWKHWFFGFSQLIAGELNSAEREFMSTAISSKDALIAGLSSYFLQSSIAKFSLKPDECRSIAENGRKRVIDALKTAEAWTKEADRMGTDIHIAIIRKYIDEAGEWLYSDIREQYQYSEPNEVSIDSNESEEDL